MSKAETLQELIAALEERAQSEGFELVQVEMTGTSKSPVLRVYLDKEGGITLDDIAEAQQAWLEAIIDEIDPYQGSYILEVSSPGVDRPLRKLDDYSRFAGEEARVTVEADGKPRKRTGILQGVRDGRIVLEVEGTEESYSLDEIRKANIIGRVDFSKGKEE